MELYFSPLACSLATRIALYEANADAQFIEVDTKSKQLRDGSDFYPINPLGQVPVLRTDDGWLLRENTAILPYVADAFPAARLAPAAGTAERAKLQEWLGFISTELHKGVFVPLLDPHAPTDVRAYTRKKISPPPRFARRASSRAGISHWRISRCGCLSRHRPELGAALRCGSCRVAFRRRVLSSERCIVLQWARHWAKRWRFMRGTGEAAGGRGVSRWRWSRADVEPGTAAAHSASFTKHS